MQSFIDTCRREGITVVVLDTWTTLSPSANPLGTMDQAQLAAVVVDLAEQIDGQVIVVDHSRKNRPDGKPLSSADIFGPPQKWAAAEHVIMLARSDDGRRLQVFLESKDMDGARFQLDVAPRGSGREKFTLAGTVAALVPAQRELRDKNRDAIHQRLKTSPEVLSVDQAQQALAEQGDDLAERTIERHLKALVKAKSVPNGEGEGYALLRAAHPARHAVGGNEGGGILSGRERARLEAGPLSSILDRAKWTDVLKAAGLLARFAVALTNPSCVTLRDLGGYEISSTRIPVFSGAGSTSPAEDGSARERSSVSREGRNRSTPRCIGPAESVASGGDFRTTGRPSQHLQSGTRPAHVKRNDAEYPRSADPGIGVDVKRIPAQNDARLRSVTSPSTRRTGISNTIELVDAVGNMELNVREVHEVLAILLLRYYEKVAAPWFRPMCSFVVPVRTRIFLSRSNVRRSVDGRMDMSTRSCGSLPMIGAGWIPSGVTGFARSWRSPTLGGARPMSCLCMT